MHPRAMRDTLRPDRPRLMYSTRRRLAILPLVGFGGTMQRHGSHHQGNSGYLAWRGNLPQHDGAYDGGTRRQQREHHRETRARQARHRELIADIRNDGRADSNTDAGKHEDGMSERSRRLDDSNRKYRDKGNRH